MNEPGDQPSKPKRKSWLFRLIRVGVIAYLALCVLAFLGQNWLLFPAHKSQGTVRAQFKAEPGTRKLSLKTRDGTPIAALFGPAVLADGKLDPHPELRPTILYFYGNGGAVAWSWNELWTFRQLDANVLIPDFAGYGESGGSPSESSLYATADAAYDYLISRKDIDHSKIITFGWSLGGAVAIDLASRRPVAGLATFNAFTTLREMGHRLLPFLPTRWLMRYTFDNETKVRSIHCPMLICNGAIDTTIPPSMSDRLAAAAGGPVTRVVLPLADHNTIFTANHAILEPALENFVRDVAEGPATRP